MNMVETAPQRQCPADETNAVNEVINAPATKWDVRGGRSRPLPELLNFFIKNFVFTGDGLLDREQEHGIEELTEDLRKESDISAG